jgi:hypothetical protein
MCSASAWSRIARARSLTSGSDTVCASTGFRAVTSCEGGGTTGVGRACTLTAVFSSCARSLDPYGAGSTIVLSPNAAGFGAGTAGPSAVGADARTGADATGPSPGDATGTTP